ncbi:STAS domain-containing protein [Streptomyces sp. NPDC017260]|uniref:STAS domain-containing protein n=1 Tax=unclassified Streptomyces TaxID=2593676 RepID=UPI0037B6A695
MTFLPPPCEPCDPPGYAVLALPPEIDFCNATGLLPLITTAVDHHTDSRSDGLRVLVLDLTATRFMDSQGVRLLDRVRRRLPDGARLRVVAAPRGVPSRVLELSGLRRDVPVYDSLTEALRPSSGTAGGPGSGAGSGSAA